MDKNSRATEGIIRSSDFELITELQRTDAKKRISLGPAIDQPGLLYNLYRNRLGQIVLDPVKAVPAYETWLFEDKEALASVKRGLADRAAGRVKDLGSFAAHASEE